MDIRDRDLEDETAAALCLNKADSVPTTTATQFHNNDDDDGAIRPGAYAVESPWATTSRHADFDIDNINEGTLHVAEGEEEEEEEEEENQQQEDVIVAYTVEEHEEEGEENRVELEHRLEEAKERLALYASRPLVVATTADDGTAEHGTRREDNTTLGSLSFLGRHKRFLIIIALLTIVILVVTISAIFLSIQANNIPPPTLTSRPSTVVPTRAAESETPPPTFQPTMEPQRFCSNSSCWVQLGFDITGSQKGGRFGWPVSLSADGSRLAVSAWQNDQEGIDAGLVRVFDIDAEEDGVRWKKQIGLDIYGERPDDIARGFLSGDGKRMVVGAPRSDSIDRSKVWVGQVRVFEWQPPGSWKQIGDSIYGGEVDNYCGRYPGVSFNGSIVAIGSQWHSSEAGLYDGHVRVFWYDSANKNWKRLGPDIDGAVPGDEFGYSVSLSDDGMIVCASAIYNDAGGADSGHVRLFRYDDSGKWVQMGGDINGTSAAEEFGSGVTLSSNGKIFAAAAPYADRSGPSSGYAQVFSYDENADVWSNVGGEIVGDAGGDRLGAVTLTADGTRLATGSHNAKNNTGYVQVYDIVNGTWQPVGGKLTGRKQGESFGASVALSSDGSRLAVGGTSWSTEPPRKGLVRIYELHYL